MSGNIIITYSRTICIALLSVFLGACGGKTQEQEYSVPENLTESNVGGYLISKVEKMDQAYGGGYSMYVNVYPLLQTYTGRQFQSGLFGTWMFPYNDPEPSKKMYTDIEGGLGWWRANHYASETPKFSMGGVQVNFSCWANGPGAGKGRDWSKDDGKYGVAQLSPWILFPPDKLNIAQGSYNEFLGSGYLPLPLTEPKATTEGKKIATGNQCWTLFLNTRNFKGPVAFFTPYFWSKSYLIDPAFEGLCLDQRPSDDNKGFQQETQHIHAYEAVDAQGAKYIRMAPVQYPTNANGDAELLHRLMVYKKEALWNRVEAWFHGGPVADTRIDVNQGAMQKFIAGTRSSWSFFGKDVPREKRAKLNITDFMDFTATDESTLKFHWQGELTTEAKTRNGEPIMILPQYYKWVQKDASDSIGTWIAVDPKTVPAETNLQKVIFKNREEPEPMAYTTPEEPSSCWKTPGPVAGPFKARLGDGSTVTYYWYRFCDQPALLNADMTPAEREEMQRRVELLHRYWTKDKEYLPAPLHGELTSIDPALIVTPPKGYEIGYVPIVTRQGIE